MRAVRNTLEGVRVVQVPTPEPAPGSDGVRIRIRSTGICGTDLNMLAMGPADYTLGHEFGGELADGTPVAIEPIAPCRTCDQCRLGVSNRCRNFTNYGIFWDGGLADEIVVDPYCLVPLPRALPVANAALCEPASVALHGIRRAATQGGERVAIVGGGSIGLLAAAAAKRLGCEVDLVARHPVQLAAAEKIGVGRAATGEYDVVVDAAGSASAVAACCDLARPGARLVLLGVYFDMVPLPGATSLIKELTILQSMAYCRHAGGRDFDNAAIMLAEQPEIAQAIVTHRFGLDDASEAFRVAADRASGAIKVVLEP